VEVLVQLDGAARTARESVEVLVTNRRYYADVLEEVQYTAGPPPVYVAGGTTNVQDGDMLFLQASASSAQPALVLPVGWTQIVASKGFQHNFLLAYRIWHTGDPTTASVTNAQSTAISVYRGVGSSPVVTYNWWNTEVGGQVSITEEHTLVIDTMFNESLSTFGPTAPVGETLRYGFVSAGHGQAMADTSGSTIPVGTFDPPDWGGFTASTGTTSGVMVVIRPQLVPLVVTDSADAVVSSFRTTSDGIPEPGDTAADDAMLARFTTDSLSVADVAARFTRKTRTASDFITAPTDAATGTIHNLFIRFGVETLEAPRDAAFARTIIGDFLPSFEAPGRRLTRIQPGNVPTTRVAQTWSADVEVSKPRPPTDRPVLVDMGGFGFTTGGLAHNLTEEIIEETYSPSYAPEVTDG